MEIRVVSSMKDYQKELDAKVKMMIETDYQGPPISGMVMEPEVFAKVFTPERLKLLRKLKENGYHSIYQLAKDMDKPYEVVFRNVKYLEGIGLIRIDDEDNRKVPHLVGDIKINLFGTA